ncbi:hypothetical protein ACFXPQ_02685 [Streptomyces lydicus]|uniref:hypothetical protein n=1 Tax=Streptomyces lydicus TaxID=47763 RepID=UPI0036813056
MYAAARSDEHRVGTQERLEKMMREPTKTNRALLALIGLVLLGGGLLVLAGGADIYRRFHLMPPAGWPLTTAHNVLITSADQTRWTGRSWWWLASLAALALLALLALAWLLLQRRRRPRHLTVADSSQEGVTVSSHALSDALKTDLDTLPGVRGSHVFLYGPGSHPQARIALVLSPCTSPVQIWDGVHGAVDRARWSVGWSELRTRVLLSVAPPPPAPCRMTPRHCSRLPNLTCRRTSVRTCGTFTIRLPQPKGSSDPTGHRPDPGGMNPERAPGVDRTLVRGRHAGSAPDAPRTAEGRQFTGNSPLKPTG